MAYSVVQKVVYLTESRVEGLILLPKVVLEDRVGIEAGERVG